MDPVPQVTEFAQPGLQSTYVTLSSQLPDFLTGVPVTLGINQTIQQGGITLTFPNPVIVYRVKSLGWRPSDEEDLYTEIENRNDVFHGATAKSFYRNLPAGQIKISTYSHILFFVQSYTTLEGVTHGLTAAADSDSESGGRIVANSSGGVDVTYSLCDTGGSGLSVAKIWARLDGGTTPETQDKVIQDGTSVGDPVASGCDLTHSVPANLLQPYSKYVFYFAARDAEGWYSVPHGDEDNPSVPGTLVPVPISNNGGRTRDIHPPTVALTVALATSNNGAQNAVDISAVATDTGGSGIASVHVYHSDVDETLTAAQVKAKDDVALYSWNRQSDGTGLASQTVTFTANSLGSNRKKYFVHAVATDFQQVDDGDDAAASTVTRATPNSNSGYLKDMLDPAVNITSITVNNSTNKIKISYDATDTGDGGLTKVELAGNRNNQAVSIEDSATISGHPSSYNNKNFVVEGSEVEESETYTFVVTATDRDGNTGAATQSVTTRDITKPTASISAVTARTDGGVNVTYSVSESGGSGLSSAKLHLNSTDTSLAADTLIGLNNSGVTKTVTATSGTTVTFAASGLTEWTQYRAFIVAKDKQGWYSTSGSTFGSTGNFTGVAISNNSNRTYDKTGPSMGGTLTLETVTGHTDRVKVAWTNVTDSGSGLASVKVVVTTSSSTFTASQLDNATASTSTRWVATDTSSTAAGNKTLTGINATGTLYGWAVAKDNQGNLSSAKRTTPMSLTLLDTTDPVVSVPTVTVNNDNSVKVEYTVTDAGGSGIASIKVSYASTTGSDTGDEDDDDVTGNPNSHTGSVTFSKDNFSDYTDYTFTVTATDGDDNEGSNSTTAKTKDLTAPVFSANPTMTSNNSDQKITINWNNFVSDALSGMASVQAVITTSSADMTAAQVYAATENGDVTRVFTDTYPGQAGSATFTSIPYSTDYYGWVAAKDVSGSMSVSPTSPTTIQVLPQSTSTHNSGWNANSNYTVNLGNANGRSGFFTVRYDATNDDGKTDYFSAFSGPTNTNWSAGSRNDQTKGSQNRTFRNVAFAAGDLNTLRFSVEQHDGKSKISVTLTVYTN